METPTFLYKPNFCAECGEKIERESWHFWSSRRFCENCEPVYRMNRIFPAALAGTLLFFGGMFFGQIGQRYERQPAIVSTQSALSTISPVSAEKLPPAAPKQLFAANQASQDRNSAADQAPLQNLSPPETAKSQAPGNLPAPQTPVAVYTCGARTQKGTPCSRRVRAFGTRCWQHFGKPSMLENRK